MKSSQPSTHGQRTLLIISAIAIAAFMSALDGSIVNIALPTISEAFDISTGLVSWVSTAYLLVVTSSLLICGKIADIRGLKKIFLVGFIVFTLGSFLCGFLPVALNSFGALIGARVLQAIGGAMLAAIAPAMVSTFIPIEERGRSMGLVVTFASLGAAAGPFLGGLLTEFLSWHWIFFINVPVGIGAVILGARVLPDHQPEPGRTVGFDAPGAAFLFAGMMTGVFALNMGTSMGFTSPLILLAAAVALVCAALFVYHERRVEDPLLDLDLFRERNFLYANLAVTLIMIAFAGSAFLLPFFLEYVKGLPTFSAGMVMTAFSFAMMIGGPVAGALFNRVGGRRLTLGGAALAALAFVVLAGLHPDSSVFMVAGALGLLGFAIGLYVAPNNTMVMNKVGAEKRGMVSSLLNTERYGGQSLGIVLFELVLIQTVLSTVSHAGVTSSSLASVTIDQKLAVLTAGFDMAFWVGAALAVLALGFSFLVKEDEVPAEVAEETPAAIG
ncbi:MFS transporter [Methanofollis aquaemaris]|nr:MFS transporter [Methanofollis aquaemaris]